MNKVCFFKPNPNQISNHDDFGKLIILNFKFETDVLDFLKTKLIISEIRIIFAIHWYY